MSEQTMIPIVGPSDVNQITAAIQQDKDDFLEEISFAVTPATADITVSYGASKLLAAGSDVLSGRTSIELFNYGPCSILVGPSSESAIYESGMEIPPGRQIVLNASDAVKLYARSRGYKCKVRVTEK